MSQILWQAEVLWFLQAITDDEIAFRPLQYRLFQHGLVRGFLWATQSISTFPWHLGMSDLSQVFGVDDILGVLKDIQGNRPGENAIKSNRVIPLNR
jgi:hypothetical protein